MDDDPGMFAPVDAELGELFVSKIAGLPGAFVMDTFPVVLKLLRALLPFRQPYVALWTGALGEKSNSSFAEMNDPSGCGTNGESTIAFL